MSQPPIPPRPARSKSPLPAIPPRPVRNSTPREPTPNLIAESTELHAPRAARPVPVPKTSSDFAITPASITPASTTPAYRDEPVKSPKSPQEGIPQIGRRVPMDPNAGDVQAPTPNATPSGGRKKHVYREEWEMEEGAYGQPGRGKTPYSMSSTDLNAVVAHAESVGVGASPRDDGVPDEELGYIASDHYAKNMSRDMSRAQSPNHGESKRVSPAGSNDGREEPATIEEESDEVIHIDEPTHGAGILRHGTADVNSRAQSPHEEEEAVEREEASILALDEVLKRQKGQYMQAAITPRGARSRPRSALEEPEEQAGEEGLKVKTERPGAVRTPYEELSPVDEKAKPLFEEEEEDREEKPLPKELHEKIRPRLNEARFPSNDTWEEAPSSSQLSATVESPTQTRAAATGDEEEHDPESKAHQRRNSNEPEPEYVQGQPGDHYQPGDEFEQAQREKQDQRAAQDYSVDLKHLPEDERLQRLLDHGDTPSSETPSHRSRNARKFPSNDTWEDVPPSLDLEATIDPEPVERDRATTFSTTSISAAAPRPTTGAPLEVPPTTARKPEVPTIPARPAVPARPKPIKAPSAENSASPTSPTKPTPPSIPGRPKPTIPARPTRPAKPAVLARMPSSDEPPAPKPKPIVPPRTGGKIAALKAGLGDLESRLRLGPSAPKKHEEPAEEKEMEKAVEVKEPLVDARKTRTRGPRGRKLPTAAEKTEAVKPPAAAKQVEKLEIAGVWTVWTVDEDLDAVIVGSRAAAIDDEPVVVEKPAEAPKPTDKPAEEKPATPEPVEENPSPPAPASPAAEVHSSIAEVQRAKDVVTNASAPSEPEFGAQREVPLPTTTTLVGVDGTGNQIHIATEQEVKKPEVPEHQELKKPEVPEHQELKKPEVPEHTEVPQNPTAIPDTEHPEDASDVKGAGVESEKPVAEEGFETVEREDVKGGVSEIKQGEEAEVEQKEVVKALDGAELGERLEREG